MSFQQVDRSGINCWQVSKWSEEGLAHGFLEGQLDIREEEAQRQFTSAFLSAEQQLLLLNQVHGDTIVDIGSLDVEHIDSVFSRALDADAWLYTPQSSKLSDLCLGIITADCLPVLLYERKSKAIAAAHCGWRGVVSNLLLKLIDQLQNAVSGETDLELAIGPGAGGEAYEIGESVASCVQESAASIDLSAIDNQIIFPSRPGHFLCDLKALLAYQAHSKGIPQSKIFVHPGCTISDERFFSFRRQKALSGRQLSFISSTTNPQKI